MSTSINRTLCLDVGDVRIGIAVSDLLGIIANGIETYTRKGESDAQYIADIAKAQQANVIVFGLPRMLNGTYGVQSEKVRAFADEVAAVYDGKIEFFDERLTTAAAERILLDADMSRKKRRKVIDKMAAMIILQNYLDSRGTKL